MKTITQKEEQHAAACCSETKNRYICISEESEGTSPDTLFETLPWNELEIIILIVHLDVLICFVEDVLIFNLIIDP